ncbi:MAG: DegT/DnrJ/EryC1/StrS family aminotransferase, partial [Gammaproteobacteria bacterium]|nr:DegT/DnrJ/EryC1/StrS family aminotransferase [Gammaproteobacteria bacterium]
MEKKLAIFGGKPVRESILQYGKQSIDQTDVDAVVDVLNSAWLTTGPYVENFEKSVAQYTQANNAISVSSGTAALHTALAALDLCENDEVIVPSITFLATANSVVFVGAKPVFADVYADTLLIDPNSVETLISDRTKAIICVDFAGQCCDYDAINKIANKQGIKVIADACHSLGAKRDGVSVGKLADISVLSFHPVKNITTAEGGMLLTNDDSIAHKARLFRNHGMDRDHNARSKNQSWRYSMFEIGYNYRLSDLHAALGASQLKRLPAFNKRRLEIAKQYDYALQNIEYVTPVKRDGLNEHV